MLVRRAAQLQQGRGYTRHSRVGIRDTRSPRVSIPAIAPIRLRTCRRARGSAQVVEHAPDAAFEVESATHRHATRAGRAGGGDT